MVSALEREREKNSNSSKVIQESQKLSQIEEKVENAIYLIDQLEKE